MLETDILSYRKAISDKIRSCRKAYGITITDVHIHSGLAIDTIMRLEHGSKAWTIDSQIAYLNTLIELSRSNMQYQNRIKHWPGKEIEDIQLFIFNQHNPKKL